MTATPTNGEQAKSEPFGRIPYWILDDDAALGSMVGADAKVYMALAAHAGEHWTARPSFARLAKVTRLTERCVISAVQRLAAAGLLRVEHGGGRGHANLYHLVRSKGEARITVQPNSVPEETLNGDAQSLNPGALNTDPPFRPTDMNRTEQQQEVTAAAELNAGTDMNRTEQQQEVTAAAELNAGLVDALTAVGIGPPLRSTLAALPDLTVRMVQEEGDKVACRPLIVNKPAIIAANLQTRCQAEAQRRRQAAAAEQRLQQEREQERRAAGDDAERDEAGQRQIADMTDGELLSRAAIAMEAHPFHRRRWETQIQQRGLRIVATNNRNLRNAILSRHNEVVELCGTNC